METEVGWFCTRTQSFTDPLECIKCMDILVGPIMCSMDESLDEEFRHA